MKNPIKALIGSRMRKHRQNALSSIEGSYAANNRKIHENAQKIAENKRQIARLDKNKPEGFDKARSLLDDNKRLNSEAVKISRNNKVGAEEKKRVNDAATAIAKKKVIKEAAVATAATAGTVAAGVGAYKYKKAKNAKNLSRYDSV